MRHITENYIAGAFRPVLGTATAPLFDPATATQIGTVRLSDDDDVDAAVAAATEALPALASTSPAERADMLRRLGAAFSRHTDRLAEAMRAEYGAPARSSRSARPMPDRPSRRWRTRPRPIPGASGSAMPRWRCARPA